MVGVNQYRMWCGIHISEWLMKGWGAVVEDEN